jgi:hypothetical protein
LLLQLRPGFPKHNILALASQYRYPGGGTCRGGLYGDEAPQEIGERSRKAGYFTREDFLEICDWKSARPRGHCALNSAAAVRAATATALDLRSSEEDRIRSLLQLDGVGLPMASVLLHFAHTDRYPMLDVRALWTLGVNKKLNYHSLELWHEYVRVCRSLADECGVSMRDLDRALWQFSKENQ